MVLSHCFSQFGSPISLDNSRPTKPAAADRIPSYKKYQELVPYMLPYMLPYMVPYMVPCVVQHMVPILGMPKLGMPKFSQESQHHAAHYLQQWWHIFKEGGRQPTAAPDAPNNALNDAGHAAQIHMLKIPIHNLGHTRPWNDIKNRMCS